MESHLTVFSVFLVGGIDVNEGNVFATNSATGIYGPVCDDNWNYNAVKFT